MNQTMHKVHIGEFKVIIKFLRETLFTERHGSGLCWCLVEGNADVSGEISRNCQPAVLPQAQFEMFSSTDLYF